MVIGLKSVKESIGESVAFDYLLDLSEAVPAADTPVRVFGVVTNRAGVLLLDMTIEATLHLVCDRCLDEFSRKQSVDYHVCIAESSEEDCDEILVCPTDTLELDELARTAFVLAQETKVLCQEDCKGLCPKCGTNLNTSTCNCAQAEVDPRLEALRQLLEE